MGLDAIEINLLVLSKFHQSKFQQNIIKIDYQSELSIWVRTHTQAHGPDIRIPSVDAMDAQHDAYLF